MTALEKTRFTLPGISQARLAFAVRAAQDVADATANPDVDNHGVKLLADAVYAPYHGVATLPMCSVSLEAVTACGTNRGAEIHIVGGEVFSTGVVAVGCILRVVHQSSKVATNSRSARGRCHSAADSAYFSYLLKIGIFL